MTDRFRIGLDRGFFNADGTLAWGDIGISGLERSPDVAVEPLEHRYDELPPEVITAYDGFILGGTAVTRASFAAGAGRALAIVRAGVGYDRIDVRALTDNDVVLCTTPAASRHAVASATFAYVIALGKQMAAKDRIVRQNRWSERGAFAGNEILGKTLGVVGFGNTGSELARLVAPFRMRVLAYDPYLDADRVRGLGAESVSLDDLLRQADFVCVHAMLNERTRGLLGAREFALMKRSAYVINCARGPIIDEGALIQALQAGQIAGAGLDVFEEEPLAADSPLIAMENVMLSPHTMAHTLELSIWMGEINTSQLLAVASGLVPESVVNRDVADRPGFKARLARWQRA
jgi:phosphoglycerate dehydrogenase-like enzyme